MTRKKASAAEAAAKRELARQAEREVKRQEAFDKSIPPSQPQVELKPKHSFWYPLYRWLGGKP